MQRVMALPKFTLGIEEEYQIIHPETRELSSFIQEFMDDGREILRDQMKPEFMQSQVEVGSSICNSIQEARQELLRLRGAVIKVAAGRGLVVAASGTHPFSKWSSQRITSGERYTKYAQGLADVARRMLVFGMHVHIGIDDPELRIDVMNQSRYFLPHLLALSASSPFWHGRNTGLMSYRTIVLGNLPRSGLPPFFKSWSDYQSFIDALIETECIEEPTNIWWDIRPNPNFPTVEYRFADICPRVDDAVCIAALVLGIVAKLIQLRRANICWRGYRRNLITENKWRAVRYGTEGHLIDFGKREQRPARELIHEIIEFIDDVLDELNIRKEVEYAYKILDEGSSAHRQLAVYEQSGNLNDVVDHIVEETRQPSSIG
jgi:carboxylate-amine ligase